jgi:hypothetical protein
MHVKMSILGAMTVLVAGLVVVVGVSHAQYPPPGGGITLETSETSTDTGGDTLLTCSVFEEDGPPVANVLCTFTIVSEPGNDAAVGSKTVSKLTNAQGIATTNLYVGSTPGIIVIEAESRGDTSTVLVTVEGEASSPPQSPVSNIQPPSTGSGGLAH